MANELNLLTGVESQQVRADIRENNWVVVAASVQCLSAGPGGLYSGSFPVAVTTADTYNVIFHTSGNSSEVLGVGQIVWNGSAEVNPVNNELDKPITELVTAQPVATPTLRNGLMLLYMALRNKTVVATTGTDELGIYDSADGKIAKKLVTDDGSDYTEAQIVSGP